jgi:hypothetical protein
VPQPYRNSRPERKPPEFHRLLGEVAPPSWRPCAASRAIAADPTSRRLTLRRRRAHPSPLPTLRRNGPRESALCATRGGGTDPRTARSGSRAACRYRPHVIATPWWRSTASHRRRPGVMKPIECHIDMRYPMKHMDLRRDVLALVVTMAAAACVGGGPSRGEERGRGARCRVDRGGSGCPQAARAVSPRKRGQDQRASHQGGSEDPPARRAWHVARPELGALRARGLVDGGA